MGVLLLFAGLVGFLAWEMRPLPPDSELPPLARDLPRTFTDGQKAFSRRVQARFPAGAPDEAIIAELKREGFSMHAGRASFEQSAFPCRLFWNIAWTTDAVHRIAAIKAEYGAGCL